MGGEPWTSVRSLMREKTFALTVVATLAVGIASATAIFSVVNSIVLKPLPYRDPDALVRLFEVKRSAPLDESSRSLLTVSDYMELALRAKSFDQLGAIYEGIGLQLTGAEEPTRVDTAMVTHDLFPLLGRKPLVGRTFLPSDGRPGAEPVVLLNEGFWRRRMGGDRSVVGKPLILNGRPTTVVGVLPDDFRFPSAKVEMWTPLVLDAARANPWAHVLVVVGRLRPKATLEQARQELRSASIQLEQENPRVNKDLGFDIAPLKKVIVGDTERPLWILLAAVALVLLIVFVNVANLCLLRSLAQQAEVAVRTALGATPRRILRKFITEGILLASVGGVLGILVSYWAVALFVAASPQGIPRLEEVRIDGSALGVGLAISLLASLMLGVIPGISAFGASDLHETLGTSGRRSVGRHQQRARAALVIGEIAIAVTLLVGAGLMANSLLRLLNVDPGFRSKGILTLKLTLPRSSYPSSQKLASFFDQALTRLTAVPGVTDVGMVNFLPLVGERTLWTFLPEGRVIQPGQEPTGSYFLVGGNYFRTVHTPLLQGRAFGSGDHQPGAETVIINQKMAQLFWPKENPLGKRFKLGSVGSWNPWLTIIGVVGDVRQDGLGQPIEPAILLPFSSESWDNTMTFVVRTSGNPAAVASDVRMAIWGLDRNLPVYQVSTLDDVLSASLAKPRFNLLVISAYSCVALFLALIGIYGIIAHSVVQQRQRIAIQMALGATRGGVLLAILRKGLALVLAGISLGVLFTIGAGRMLESMLYDVTATDPLTLVAVISAFLAVAIFAILVPAHSATRVDPIICLKE